MGLGALLGQMPTAWSPALSVSGAVVDQSVASQSRLIQAWKVSDIHSSTPSISVHLTLPQLWCQLRANEADWRTNTFTPHLYSCVIPETIRIL